MNIILFDDPVIRPSLLPFTFTRPVAGIRVGILTIAEKWQTHTGAVVSFLTQDYLREKFPVISGIGSNLYVNGAVCPDEGLLQELRQLSVGQALYRGDTLIAYNSDYLEITGLQEFYDHLSLISNRKEVTAEVTLLREIWEIFRLNGQQIRSDFKLVTQGRKSQPVHDVHTKVYVPENIFIEEGVKIRAAVLNAENGPIYLGKHSQVHEGAIIKGPFALGQESNVTVGAKMRGDITIGPFCKVGGEVSNSVFFAYSNKGHEGYLGNSVIGEWCNLGADTNNSNLKNNYADIKIWNYPQKGFKQTSLQFCGLMMGDHTKCGINTMFNTATVVGVSANVFGAGFPRTFIPDFSWGGAAGLETYKLDKALEVASKVMERRELVLDQVERDILTHIFEETRKFRRFEG
jgi:UDP-N-acetylglucosamine diphosphorylase/glucosamine-1-phosphate N-acetyltransferase